MRWVWEGKHKKRKETCHSKDHNDKPQIERRNERLRIEKRKAQMQEMLAKSELLRMRSQLEKSNRWFAPRTDFDKNETYQEDIARDKSEPMETERWIQSKSHCWEIHRSKWGKINRFTYFHFWCNE